MGLDQWLRAKITTPDGSVHSVDMAYWRRQESISTFFRERIREWHYSYYGKRVDVVDMCCSDTGSRVRLSWVYDLYQFSTLILQSASGGEQAYANGDDDSHNHGRINPRLAAALIPDWEDSHAFDSIEHDGDITYRLEDYYYCLVNTQDQLRPFMQGVNSHTPETLPALMKKYPDGSSVEFYYSESW